MKKAIIILLLILFLNMVFSQLLNYMIDLNNFELFYSLKIVIKLVLIALTIYYIFKSKINIKLYSYNILSFVISLVAFFLAFNYVSNIISSENLSIPLSYNILFFTSCLCVAFFEEFLIRVFLFENFYSSVKSNKNPLVYSIIIVSAIFGIVHITNALYPNIGIMAVTVQIFFAFAMGILFQTILIKFNSIVIIVAMHTLVNYIGMYKSTLFKYNSLESTEKYTIQDFISSLMFMSVAALFFLLISYIILKKHNYTSKLMKTN